MHVWIAKYALSGRIMECEAERLCSPAIGVIKVAGGGTSSADYYYHEGCDWHLTREAAVAKAEDMRKNKIASLHKQIKRLESLRFDKGDG
jgi:hypothetical protein